MSRRASLSLCTLGTLVLGSLVLATGACSSLCSSLPDLHFDDGAEGGDGWGSSRSLSVGTTPTAQGALTFTDERTICCK